MNRRRWQDWISLLIARVQEIEQDRAFPHEQDFAVDLHGPFARDRREELSWLTKEKKYRSAMTGADPSYTRRAKFPYQSYMRQPKSCPCPRCPNTTLATTGQESSLAPIQHRCSMCGFSCKHRRDVQCWICRAIGIILHR